MTVSSALLRAARSCLSSPSLDRGVALSLTERVDAVTHLIASLEFLAAEQDRRPGGVNDWESTRDAFVSLPAPVRKILGAAANRHATRALHVTRAVAAAALLAPLPRRARLAADAVVAGSALLLYPRHRYGSDGADQVSFIVMSVATAARAAERDPRVVDACLWFIGSQSVLSYAVSGWVKMASPTWRSGRALPGVMRTETYGDARAYELIRRHPRAARAVGASVLALECAFPVVYLGRGRLAPLMVAAAGTFHLANARLMGLGRFVWSFASMYPAVLYTAGRPTRPGTDGRLDVRHDAFPGVAAAVLGAGWVAAGYAAVRNRRAVRAGQGDEAFVNTASGNTLAYRWLSPPEQDPGGEPRPLVLLENGLGASDTHWEHIAQRLSRRYHVLTYQRAGYGRSEYRGRSRNGSRGRSQGTSQGFTLDAAADDLVDLVKQSAGDRPVVLVGHSLGGYLALKAAGRLPGHVAGLCLIDSAHPQELRRSPRQAGGRQQVTALLTQVPVSLALGLGVLLKRPVWADQLPVPVRARALAEYRDRRQWSAALREWRAVLADFEAFRGPLPSVETPLLVLTASATAVRDPEHHALHAEMAQLSPHNRHVVVEHSDHDGLLADPYQAERVAVVLEEFLNEAVGTPVRREEDGDDQSAR